MQKYYLYLKIIFQFLQRLANNIINHLLDAVHFSSSHLESHSMNLKIHSIEFFNSTYIFFFSFFNTRPENFLYQIHNILIICLKFIDILCMPCKNDFSLKYLNFDGSCCLVVANTKNFPVETKCIYNIINQVQVSLVAPFRWSSLLRPLPRQIASVKRDLSRLGENVFAFPSLRHLTRLFLLHLIILIIGPIFVLPFILFIS